MGFEPTTVAVLFADPKGVYSTLPGVDLWDEARDATRYAGPHPVVAHPPCARWSVLARLVEAVHGIPAHEDGGVFESALASVRAWGGVLEHPAQSAAWVHHRLRVPLAEGWCAAGDGVGWTCQVAQCQYGHEARKRTWLYAVGCDLPRLRWGDGEHAPAALAARGGRIQGRLSRRARSATPPAFAQLLLSIARTQRVSLRDCAPVTDGI